MTYDTEDLLGLPVFNGVFEQNLEEMLGCIHAKTEDYQSGTIILNQELYENKIGLVLSGSLDISAITEDGHLLAIARLTPYEMFGRGFFQRELLHRTDGSGGQTEDLAQADWHLSATAVEDCTVLLFDYNQAVSPCWFSCFYHSRFIDNAIRIAADQNKRYLKTGEN